MKNIMSSVQSCLLQNLREAILFPNVQTLESQIASIVAGDEIPLYDSNLTISNYTALEYASMQIHKCNKKWTQVILILLKLGFRKVHMHSMFLNCFFYACQLNDDAGLVNYVMRKVIDWSVLEGNAVTMLFLALNCTLLEENTFRILTQNIIACKERGQNVTIDISEFRFALWQAIVSKETNFLREVFPLLLRMIKVSSIDYVHRKPTSSLILSPEVVGDTYCWLEKTVSSIQHCPLEKLFFLIEQGADPCSMNFERLISNCHETNAVTVLPKLLEMEALEYRKKKPTTWVKDGSTTTDPATENRENRSDSGRVFTYERTKRLLSYAIDKKMPVEGVIARLLDLSERGGVKSVKSKRRLIEHAVILIVFDPPCSSTRGETWKLKDVTYLLDRHFRTKDDGGIVRRATRKNGTKKSRAVVDEKKNRYVFKDQEEEGEKEEKHGNDDADDDSDDDGYADSNNRLGNYPDKDSLNFVRDIVYRIASGEPNRRWRTTATGRGCKKRHAATSLLQLSTIRFLFLHSVRRIRGILGRTIGGPRDWSTIALHPDDRDTFGPGSHRGRYFPLLSEALRSFRVKPEINGYKLIRFLLACNCSPLQALNDPSSEIVSRSSLSPTTSVPNVLYSDNPYANFLLELNVNKHSDLYQRLLKLLTLHMLLFKHRGIDDEQSQRSSWPSSQRPSASEQSVAIDERRFWDMMEKKLFSLIEDREFVSRCESEIEKLKTIIVEHGDPNRKKRKGEASSAVTITVLPENSSNESGSRKGNKRNSGGASKTSSLFHLASCDRRLVTEHFNIQSCMIALKRAKFHSGIVEYFEVFRAKFCKRTLESYIADTSGIVQIPRSSSPTSDSCDIISLNNECQNTLIRSAVMKKRDLFNIAISF